MTQTMAKRASSILMRHYHGQLNNPIIMARMLLLEGVFDEQDCDEVTHETSISNQNNVFNKALEKAIDDYDKLIIFAVILLKYKTTVHIGKIVLKECGKTFENLETAHLKVQEVSLAHEDNFKDMKRELLQLCIQMKKEIEKNCIPMDKLQSFLSFSFPELTDELETAESIEELLTIISIHTSVLNVLHLKNIACHYRLQTAIQLLQVYDDKLEEMSSKMLVKQLYEQTLMPNSNRPLLQSNCVKFTLNCNVGEESLCYIQQLLTIAFRTMAHHIMVKTVSTNEDKVYLLCYAPLHLCGELMSLAQKNEDDLVKNCMLGVSIAGCIVISKDELLVKENSKQLLECENVESTTVNDGIQSESDLRQENAMLWPKLEWYRRIEAKELELRTVTDEYSKHKLSCELIQSEIIKLQQVESSVTLQLQMNEQAISHLNEQIEKKHQKDLQPSYVLTEKEQNTIDTYLYEAVKNENIVETERLIKEGANPNRLLVWFQQTPLHLLSKSGHAHFVSVLLSHGADIHVKDHDGRSPLDLAHTSGKQQVVEILEQQQMKDKSLITAVSKKNNGDIQRLIKNGADRKFCDLQKALYGAVEMNCSVDDVERLMKNGANPSYHDPNDWLQQTALHLSSKNGNTDIVSVLLSHGADIHVKDSHQQTPLHLSSERGNVDIVKVLLSQDANIRVKDRDGNTPLDLARRSDKQEIVKILKEQQQIRDKLLITAVSERNNDDIQRWIKNGADPKFRDVDKALHEAVKMNYSVDDVERLLKNGANPNYLGPNYPDEELPLHLSSKSGNVDIVNTLLSYGADIHVKNRYQQTPLHLSSKSGHVLIVKSLLSHGADIHAKDKFGNAPLRLAYLFHRRDVIEYLGENLRYHKYF